MLGTCYVHGSLDCSLGSLSSYNVMHGGGRMK